MKIKQFEDKNLSHFSYAILRECEQEIILVDPARNPQQYLDYAKENEAKIIGVIETHPHADFVSSHLELHQALGATIYVSKGVHAAYPHQALDEGQTIEFGKIKLSPLNTPGHSPDSISIVLYHNGIEKAVFTGDTLFIGDCGRPDLRETAGDNQSNRLTLARQMYLSLRNKLMTLNDDVVVYPAHGAGTLCGKDLSKESSSTIGEQKQTNWSLQPMNEDEFVESLLTDQPFVPAYFPYDVALNKKGAAAMSESISKIKQGGSVSKIAEKKLDLALWVIDTREENVYKDGHLPHCINVMEKGKFETWLGSIIEPGEKFYLAAGDKEQLQRMLERAASIGYEGQVEEAFVIENAGVKEEKIDAPKFQKNENDYTIVDARNHSEINEKKIFANSLSIPLPELRNRIDEIPIDKPIVVHCAGGYRSAAASSLIHSVLGDKVKVFDLGEAVKEFSNEAMVSL